MPVDRCYELSLNGLKDKQILLEVIKRGINNDMPYWEAAIAEWNRRAELRPQTMAALLNTLQIVRP